MRSLNAHSHDTAKLDAPEGIERTLGISALPGFGFLVSGAFEAVVPDGELFAEELAELARVTLDILEGFHA